MINYIIQIILCQILFLAVYDLFLSKETFFTKNRLYLIVTVVLSFVLPLLKIPDLQKAVPQEYVILLPEVLLSPQKVIEQSSWYENINYLQVLFWLGVAVFSIIFILKLTTILRLIFSNEIHPKKNYKLVWLPKNSKAFSFFNYIFLGRGIPQEKQEKIIQHELVHSEQKHSLDLLFFELLKIVMWFNPMIYLYQKRITLVHEFISDEVVTKKEEKTSYINNLLSEIFQVEHISFINQFYKHSFIKKRVIMLTKNKSKQVKQLKYLLLVPVLGTMMTYVSCVSEVEPLAIKQEIVEEQSNTNVINVGTITDNEVEEIVQVVEELSEKDYSRKEILEKLKIVIENQQHKSNFQRGIIGYNEETIETIHEDVSFKAVDKAPKFPNSVNGSKRNFNKSMREFVKSNFDYTIVDDLNLPKGKKRILTVFKIDRDGKVVDLKVRAPHPKLKENTLKMMKKLPNFTPAEHNGIKVRVGYQLPITFMVY